MECRVENITDRLIWIAITLYFVLVPLAVVITEDSGMGKYLLLAPLLVMMAAKIISTGGKINVGICGYDLYLLAFTLFIYASSLWADNSSFVIIKANNMVEVFIAMYIIRICLPENNRIVNLLKCLMWGSFGIVAYAIFRYGWAYITYAISSDTRIVSTIINANTLGMGAAFAMVISVFLLLYNGFNLGLIASIPTFFVLAASGSRKALFIFVFGIAFLFITKNLGNKDFFKSAFYVVISLVVIIIAVYQLSKLPMFEGVNERIVGLFNGILGKGDVDHSTSVRLKMIEIGMNLFAKKPFLGVGIDNAKIYTESAFGVANYYLHNNYVELLADGGIVGTFIYYSIYIFLLRGLWKNRNFTFGEFNVVFLILILRLILDYGMVSYESKNTYFYLLIFYLEYKKLADMEPITENDA